MLYTLDQWLLFFFFYCLCGWVWESCYVSALKRRWVNRGFLHGPLLPIYGSGAIIILLATLRVQDNLWLIYLFGMAAATVLEYATGAAMEALFHVRYWDYSKQKCNLNGYICLSSTLAWGVFSILLVRVIHPPVESLIQKIPAVWTEPVAFVLTIGVTVDAVQSFRAAFDLREMLTRLTEENEDLRRLAQRAEAVSAMAGEDLRRFRERTALDTLLLADQLEAGRARLNRERDLHTLRREELLEQSLRRRTEARLSAVQSVSEILESCREKLEPAGEKTAALRVELTAALEKLHAQEVSIRSRSVKTYLGALRILRGNPSAVAGKYAEAMENLRKMGGLRRD